MMTVLILTLVSLNIHLHAPSGKFPPDPCSMCEYSTKEHLGSGF